MRKKIILIVIAVVLLLTCATVFVLADGNHITREQFFNSIAKALELKPSDMKLEFDDAEEVDPEYKENIAAGVKDGYFFGRGNGLLDPKTEITLEEVDWVLSRINFKPETKYVHSTNTVTKTEYVEVPVEKIVEKRVEIEVAKPPCIVNEDGETHYYALAADGVYTCACKENPKTNPVGTMELFKANTSTDGLDATYFETEAPAHRVLFETGYGRVYDWDEDVTYPVACNAVCLDQEGNKVAYAEFMKEFDNQIRNVRFDTENGTHYDKYQYDFGSDLIFIIQDLGEVSID